MSDLLNTPTTRKWANAAIQRHSTGIFGKLVPAIIWTDARDESGELLVDIDPVNLVNQYNQDPCIILHTHDPGKPKGQVLECAKFEIDGSKTFIAAILGFYAGGEVLNFTELGLNTKTFVQQQNLPALPDDSWIQFSADPREVDSQWIDQVISDAPLRIERTELSHNAADSAQELIKVGLYIVAIVWNPFIKAIATEAGKSTYAGVHKWIRKLLEKLAERRNPILEIQSFHSDCQVSFLIRGKDVSQHYAAHETLHNAGAQAVQLIAKLKEREMPARKLIYEFNKDSLIWFPSYAVLHDNRIITDNSALIAIEQLPTGLSLGLSRSNSPSSHE